MGGNRKKSNGTCVAEEIDRCKKKGTITFFPSELFNVCFGSILFFLTFRKRQVPPLAVPLTRKRPTFFLQFLLRMQVFDVAFTIQIRFGRKCSHSRKLFCTSFAQNAPPKNKNTLPQTGSKQPESPTTCAAVFLAWHPAD